MQMAWMLVLALAGQVDTTGRNVVPPASSLGSGSFIGGAIETRPIWERPAMGLTLQQQTEAALDRGNGRISDPATFELNRIDFSQAYQRGWVGYRTSFDAFQALWDRQYQIDRLERQNAAKVDSARKSEIESEVLAGERERWMRQMNRPRHAEAAVIDKQALDRIEKEYSMAVESAAGLRDAATKQIEADAKLAASERAALSAGVRERYAQRVRLAEVRREQKRAVVVGRGREE